MTVTHVPINPLPEVKVDAQTGKVAHPVVTVRNGKKQSPWEIDAISGATISSKAVGRLLAASTARVAPAVRQHLDQIKRGE